MICLSRINQAWNGFLICLSRIDQAGKQCLICLTRIDLVDQANLPSLITLVRGTEWYREVPRVIKRY